MTAVIIMINDTASVIIRRVVAQSRTHFEQTHGIK